MRKKRAIIFDDEPAILEMLERVLVRLDYDLLTFAEPVICPVYGDSACSCQNLHPCADAIITDYGLPRMNGLELFRNQMQRGCRIDRRNRAIISGYMPDEEVEKLDDLGITFFRKPFRLSRLTEWLQECEGRIDLSQPLGIMRKEDRHPAALTITYTFPSSGKACQGVVTDISTSGFCMKSRHPLVRSELLMITSDMPNGCRSASVCWVKTSEEGDFIAGLHRI